MTSQPATSAPAPNPFEWFRAWMVWFAMDIGGRVSWGGITQPACILFGRRMQRNREAIVRIVARVLAGTYTPRRGSSAPRPGNRRPRPPEPIPQTFGWVADLLPKDAGPFRSALLRLLQDPEMAKLLQAAPGPLGRPLRSLCWMFKLRPPPVLARPRRPSAPKPEAPRAAPVSPPEAPPVSPPVSPPAAPAQPRPPRRAASPPAPRARSRPHPA